MPPPVLSGSLRVPCAWHPLQPTSPCPLAVLAHFMLSLPFLNEVAPVRSNDRRRDLLSSYPGECQELSFAIFALNDPTVLYMYLYGGTSPLGPYRTVSEQQPSAPNQEPPGHLQTRVSLPLVTCTLQLESEPGHLLTAHPHLCKPSTPLSGPWVPLPHS